LDLQALALDDLGDKGNYHVGVRERDGVYQQVLWPWLMGLFGDAWLRVSQLDTRAKQ
jgi:hypothetical protein